MKPGRQVVLSRRRFDVDQYHRMMRAGILTEDDRVELIDGEIVEKMTISPRHAAAVDALAHTFIQARGAFVRVRIQNPITLGDHSEPEPDLVVARPREDGYAGSHPTAEDALLLVEVADSSLPFDRRAKVPIYARCGIREVWIVDLTTDALEQYRDPVDDRYATISRHTAGAVHPLAFPELAIELATILPGFADPR